MKEIRNNLIERQADTKRARERKNKHIALLLSPHPSGIMPRPFSQVTTLVFD